MASKTPELPNPYINFAFISMYIDTRSIEAGMLPRVQYNITSSQNNRFIVTLDLILI